MLILWYFSLVAHSSWNDFEFLLILNSICSAFVYASLPSEKLKAFAEMEIIFALIKWKSMKKSFKHVIETVFLRIVILICFTKKCVFYWKIALCHKFLFWIPLLLMGSVELIPFLVFCFITFAYLLHLSPWEVLILHVDNQFLCLVRLTRLHENSNSCYIIGYLASGESLILVLIYLLLQHLFCTCNCAMLLYPHLNAPIFWSWYWLLPINYVLLWIPCLVHISSRSSQGPTGNAKLT